MKNNDKEVDNRTRDEEEIAAIADMLHTLLFYEGEKKTTGVRSGKRILAKANQGLKKVFDLFRQKYRWYTHIRYI